MKNRKLPHIVWLLLILCITSAIAVFAHPGRTDSNGGHWDRSSGTYHFHTGEYAGKGSNNDSSYSESEAFTPPYDPPTDNPYKQNGPKNSTLENETSKNITSPKNTKSRTFDTVWNFIILIIIPTIFACYFFGFIYEEFLKKHMPKQKIDILNKKILEFQNYHKEINDNEIRIRDTETNICIPDIYEIGSDNLPKNKHCRSYWGKSFTLYMSKTGTKLHSKYKCCSAFKPTHICWYWKHHNFSDYLCQKCMKNYTMPDLAWYEKHLEYNRLKLKQYKLETRCEELSDEIEKLYKKCNSSITKWLIVFSTKTKNALNEVNIKYNDSINAIKVEIK